MSNAERLSDTTPLNTPALVAQGFRESVEELRQSGKMKQPATYPFVDEAMKLVDALANSPAAAAHPDAAREVLNRVTVSVIIAAGFADGMLDDVSNSITH